jgi:hypothetical protein
MSAKFRALAKPIGSHTDKELEGALAPKERRQSPKKMFRRREDAKGGALKDKHGWMGVFFAAFGLLLFSRKRRWRRRLRS